VYRQWESFVNDAVFAYVVLQGKRAQLVAVAKAFAEPLASCGYPAYIDSCLRDNSAETIRAWVEAAPGDIARRFKNMHHRFLNDLGYSSTIVGPGGGRTG